MNEWLKPFRHPGVFVYCSLRDRAQLAGVEPIASVREREGWSVIVPEGTATERGWPALLRVAWIEFGLTTGLAEIGITARAARCLADAGIACNVVAGAYHDHLFVPVERADAALAQLRALAAPDGG